jgi:replicative DNA helicase
MALEKYYSISQVPYERKSIERILTGFNDLDYFTKGLEVGVTLLVANTNAGKSTFVQGVLARAIEQGYKVFSFAGEHTAQSFLQLLYHQNSTKKD